ncbi:MAG: site-specific integrase [Hyphomicrobiales bacterium]|nr:MAG: site-specific integrase [Hyphomicrobiales bacterium]
MPKKAAELGDLQVRRLTRPGAHAVGGVAGLQLKINDAGARSWVLRTMISGKRRDMGLGGYPDVTLAQARDAARKARGQVSEGADPIEGRRQARAARTAAAASTRTFDQCVAGFMKAKSGEWSNPKHKAQWQSTLNTYASPTIGALPVAEITVTDIVRLLETIWHTKTETATRVRGRIESVLDWATIRGYRNGENPARWRGHLDQLLAKPQKIQKVKHHEAIPISQAPAFARDLRAAEGMGARALEFAMLTAARSGEVRGAQWSEIDTAAGLWTVPAERMKGKKEHRVPLSKQALALLAELPRDEKVTFVFQGSKGQALSDMTLSAVMRRMKLTAVPHGLRSTFRDWAAEQTNHSRELAEMALAHVIENQVEAAYRRGDMLAKRAVMMQEWADFVMATKVLARE